MAITSGASPLTRIADGDWIFALEYKKWSPEERHACMIYEYARESSTCIALAGQFKTLVYKHLGQQDPDQKNFDHAWSEAFNEACQEGELSAFLLSSSPMTRLPILWTDRFPDTRWTDIPLPERQARVPRPPVPNNDPFEEVSFKQLGQYLTRGLKRPSIPPKYERTPPLSREQIRATKKAVIAARPQYRKEAGELVWRNLQHLDRIKVNTSEMKVFLIDWSRDKQTIERAFKDWLTPDKWPSGARPRVQGEKRIEHDALCWLARMRLLHHYRYADLERRRDWHSRFLKIVGNDQGRATTYRKNVAGIMRDLFSGVVPSTELPLHYLTFTQRGRRTE